MARSNYGDSEDTTTEAEVLLEAGKQLGTPKQLQGFKPFVVLANQVITLEEVEPPKLHHIAQCPKFRDVKSFIGYVDRFKGDETQLFADERAGTIAAVIDYHQQDGEAQRCAHVATFAAEASPEWKAWKALDGKPQSQEIFAQFIEDNAPFITRPDGATMLEIASSIHASSSHTFSKAIRLDNGQTQLNYVENINGTAGPKGSVDIPKTFDVQLRPFLGCSAYRVEARLRYRIDGGRLAIWFDLFRAADVQMDAFNAILESVHDDTGIEPYLGSF